MELAWQEIAMLAAIGIAGLGAISFLLVSAIFDILDRLGHSTHKSKD